MILLVFEGKKREPELFTAIEQLGLFTFCSDIQSLYSFSKERGRTIMMTPSTP